MKKKKVIILIAVIAAVAVVGGVGGKFGYQKHVETVRLEQIAATNDDIKKEAEAFMVETDATKKLELFQQFKQAMEDYKNGSENFSECEKAYSEELAKMQQAFLKGYQDSLSACKYADVNAETDKNGINGNITTLNTLKETITSEYQTYATISEDDYNVLVADIDGLTASYGERVAAIEAEEQAVLQAQAEAEAVAKESAKKESSGNTESGNKENSNGSGKKNNSSSGGSSSGESGSGSTSSNQKYVYGQNTDDGWVDSSQNIPYESSTPTYQEPSIDPNSKGDGSWESNGKPDYVDKEFAGYVPDDYTPGHP